MTQDNPYQAPAANVVVGGGQDVKQPRGVAIGRGTSWLGAGWRYFTASPGPWMAATVVWLVIMLVASLVPIVNWVTGIVAPVFAAGFVAGCMRQDRGASFSFDDLFAGFRQRLGPLLIVGLLQLIAMIVIFFVLGLIGVALLFAGGNLEVFDNPQALAESGVLLTILLLILIAMLLSLPVAMAAWFAPALVLHGNKAPVEAMLLSLRGCLKNVLPFLPYGLLLILLMIPVVLTLGIGMLVVGPLFNAANYAAYKDIFLYDEVVLGLSAEPQAGA